MLTKKNIQNFKKTVWSYGGQLYFHENLALIRLTFSKKRRASRDDDRRPRHGISFRETVNQS